MTGSETARALIFVSLAVIGCLLRTYIRTANGEKEDEAHFWSSRFSQLHSDAQASAASAPAAQPAASARPLRSRSTTTSSGEVSRAVSVLHDQPPRFAPFLADSVPEPAAPLLSVGCQGTEVDEAYEDWAAMHHARGAVSEDAEASIDKLWQRRQLQKAMGVHALPHLDTLGTSGANTPTIWTSHFPAAQLRPY